MIRPRILLVTDPAYSTERVLDVVERVARVLPPGALAVQLRDKEDRRRRRRRGIELALPLRSLGVPLIVNEDLDLACDLDAAGVHLPGGASSELVASALAHFSAGFVSAAAHDALDVERARDAGLDAVLVSPIYASPGKGAARGVAALLDARRLARARLDRSELAVYALGGVSAVSAGPCAAAGADGAAVIRSLLDADDPAQEAVRLAYAFGATSQSSIGPSSSPERT